MKKKWIFKFIHFWMNSIKSFKTKLAIYECYNKNIYAWILSKFLINIHSKILNFFFFIDNLIKLFPLTFFLCSFFCLEKFSAKTSENKFLFLRIKLFFSLIFNLIHFTIHTHIQTFPQCQDWLFVRIWRSNTRNLIFIPFIPFDPFTLDCSFLK